MKKQMLIVAGFASVLLMGGCVQNPNYATKKVMYEETHQNPASDVIDGDIAPMQESTVNQPVPKMATTPVPVSMPTPPPKKPMQPELIKITGIGYGAESTYEAYTPGQRRLMAIRSSKLDAYRALAEQLYGIKIDSNTAVSTLTAKNDSFRARVNAIVRGARVVSITPMADNNYETVLEVYIDQSFFRNAFVYSSCQGGNCSPEPVDVGEVCGNGVSCRGLGSGQ